MLSKSTNIVALAILATTFSLLTAIAQDDPAAQDRKKLQGTWNVVEGEKQDMQMSFNDKKWTLKAKDNDENAFAEGTFTIDPSQKPKTMDLTVLVGKGEKLQGFVGKTSRAIYEVEGDTFKWCANQPGKDDRPKEFSRKGVDGNYLLITFKRAKE